MSLSMHIVKQMLKDKKTFDVNDLGFMSTVLRDNEPDNELHRYYSEMVKFLWNLQKEEK